MTERFAVWNQVTELDTAARNANNPKLIHRYSSQTNTATALLQLI